VRKANAALGFLPENCPSNIEPRDIELFIIPELLVIPELFIVPELFPELFAASRLELASLPAVPAGPLER
jgi:hypothetical protein